MIKKYLYLLPLFALGLFFTSCDDNATDPPGTEKKGSIFINSVPIGAQIWIGTGTGTNTGKVTPDSVTGLSVGTQTITLKLSGYRDTTFTMTVVADQKIPKTVTLSTTLVTVTYGPVRIYESFGTTTGQPSGLSLKSGRALSVTNNAQKDSVDIYYFSNSGGTIFEIRTPTTAMNSRQTRFLIGSGTSLTDNVPSPTVSGSWITQIRDDVTTYVFLYDEDGHYSKMIMTRGGGSPGTPAYVDVRWIYNLTVDDVRF